ncbi:MAG TPA: pyridoxal 5'-phosphate synthase glutaminase subunit PdxT [Microthrixaceae bacterium]|nr:pyridoxal 5'-phosphate synthase glutaminase subunit PdxT [Microthrixaceae bacterium]
MLALQGAFALHQRRFESLGAATVAVRTEADLDRCDRLVLPGGESSTISMLLERADLFEPISKRLEEGMPAFGTCAGAILLGSEILDGRPDQRCFGAIDATVRRNAYGRQVDSFEADLPVAGEDLAPLRAVFIRAPLIERVGDEAEVLASFEDHAVWCRQRAIMVCTFHPELSGDDRLHHMFLEM